MAVEQSVATFGATVDAFLARADLASSSRRSYAQTLNRLRIDLGADRELGSVDTEELGAAIDHAWGGVRAGDVEPACRDYHVVRRVLLPPRLAALRLRSSR